MYIEYENFFQEFSFHFFGKFCKTLNASYFQTVCMHKFLKPLHVWRRLLMSLSVVLIICLRYGTINTTKGLLLTGRLSLANSADHRIGFKLHFEGCTARWLCSQGDVSNTDSLTVNNFQS